MSLYLLSIVSVIFALGYIKYFFLFWIVPFFTIFPTIGWFVDFVEHYPLVNDSNTDLYMTRNRFSNIIEHFLFNVHNENFHLVHHLRPDIPFWNLKNAHNIMMKDPAYAKTNATTGGIFLSSNSAEPFIKHVIQKNRDLFSSV